MISDEFEKGQKLQDSQHFCVSLLPLCHCQNQHSNCSKCVCLEKREDHLHPKYTDSPPGLTPSLTHQLYSSGSSWYLWSTNVHTLLLLLLSFKEISAVSLTRLPAGSSLLWYSKGNHKDSFESFKSIYLTFIHWFEDAFKALVTRTAYKIWWFCVTWRNLHFHHHFFHNRSLPASHSGIFNCHVSSFWLTYRQYYNVSGSPLTFCWLNSVTLRAWLDSTVIYEACTAVAPNFFYLNTEGSLSICNRDKSTCRATSF